MVNISKRLAVCTPIFKLEALLLVGNHPVFGSPSKPWRNGVNLSSEYHVLVGHAPWPVGSNSLS